MFQGFFVHYEPRLKTKNLSGVISALNQLKDSLAWALSQNPDKTCTIRAATHSQTRATKMIARVFLFYCLKPKAAAWRF
jgi:hypothetical protein